MTDDERLPNAPAEPAPPSDIESRQDEVLRQLSDLIGRLEQTIREAQPARSPGVKRPAA